MLTRYFTWLEVVRSPTAMRLGIDNHLPAKYRGNATVTAAHMEQVRVLLGNKPIGVTSWFRCPELNAQVGGSPTSAHLKALAVDFNPPPPHTLAGALEILAGSTIPFDQLIYERTRSGADWIHLGLSLGVPRREVKRAYGLQLGGDMAFTRVLPG